MTTFPIPPNYADHILVASPSSVVRQRVLESLRTPARRFEQASGGAEALGYLENGFWQVLFLDRHLPDLDAEELGQTVRKRFPKIEVVMLDLEDEGGVHPNLDSESASEPFSDQIAASSLGHAETVIDNDGEAVMRARSSQSSLDTPLPGMIGSNSRVMQPVYRLARPGAERKLLLAQFINLARARRAPSR
jgi:DNA-binding NtrC family response regulator